MMRLELGRGRSFWQPRRSVRHGDKVSLSGCLSLCFQCDLVKLVKYPGYEEFLGQIGRLGQFAGWCSCQTSLCRLAGELGCPTKNTSRSIWKGKKTNVNLLPLQNAPDPYPPRNRRPQIHLRRAPTVKVSKSLTLRGLIRPPGPSNTANLLPLRLSNQKTQ